MAIIFAPLKSIALVRGTTWNDDVRLEEKETGDPVDLTGITSLTMRIREDINGPILLELSLTNNRLVIVDAVEGRIGFRVNSASTLLFPENDNSKAKYVYDCVIERSAGEYEPAVAGRVTVNPSITRPWGNT